MSLCSGASDSEVHIWDLSVMPPNQPTAPGQKVQPFTPVSACAWNHQVEHILASGSGGGISPCTVWDLMKPLLCSSNQINK